MPNNNNFRLADALDLKRILAELEVPFLPTKSIGGITSRMVGNPSLFDYGRIARHSPTRNL